MKAELRADGLHISGYVNVTGKMSRPVLTSDKKKVIEVIEERAFERALQKSDNIPMTLDHNENIVLAQTSDNTLKLYEDAIGLRAETIITNEEVINGAKQGRLKGWSFGMKKIVDTIEERADNLPLRHVKDFILDHVTLVMNKVPCYAATSIELRADEEDYTEIEVRSYDSNIEIVDCKETNKPEINYSDYENRIDALKMVK